MLYTFYGDDFTGSTDVLEQLASGGVRAALFFQPPTPADLERFPNLQAIGIAGESRSQSPAWMSANLPAIFQHLRSFGAPILHYKVCSTFDSSPTHGSIGRAIELGLETLPSPFVPVVVGAPHLRRFVSAGNLFASDPLGNIHRIDRHPMRYHPVTPMREPNLRRHLSLQTSLPIGEIPHSVITTANHLPAAIADHVAAQRKTIIFDAIDHTDLHKIGSTLWQIATKQPLFAVGSSGLTTALLAAWKSQSLLYPTPYQPLTSQPASSPNPLLVVSGSCSATTARQIRWSLDNNFRGLPLNPHLLLDAAHAPTLRARTLAAIEQSYSHGESILLYTALGQPSSSSQGADLGVAIGSLLHEILQRANFRRLLLCGGDTSSHAVQQLHLQALTWKRNLQTGAPLCTAHSSGPHNGLELVLKGGQIGTDHFFAVVRDSI